MKRGFTLIELLVVVLIIGILAAIALPQYQKAVLKSRYSALMPIASAVANGQEIYYMEKGNYASDITKLDIKAPSGGVNANIKVSDGTDERFEYVLATKDDLPGLAYVIYQKRSPQFPDTVMCEANDELNSKATWLCKDALKGKEEESGSLLGTGWTAYIIKGTEGSGTFEELGAPSGPSEPATTSESGYCSGSGYSVGCIYVGELFPDGVEISNMEDALADPDRGETRTFTCPSSSNNDDYLAGMAMDGDYEILDGSLDSDHITITGLEPKQKVEVKCLFYREEILL